MTITVGDTPVPSIYTGGEAFVQPVLDSNGTMGGTAFAVSSLSQYDATQPAWKAFSKVDPGWQCAWGSLPTWLSWYNPTPLRVTNIQIKNRGGVPAYIDAIKDYSVQKSDNNSTWTTVISGTNTVSGPSAVWNISLPSTAGYAKYWRIYATSSSGGSSRPGVSVFEITVSGLIEEPTPVQAVYVGDTQIWPAVPPPPLQWFRWESTQIPGLYCYTDTRNPEVGTRTYEKSGDEYVLYESVGKIVTDSGGNVSKIVTMYNPSTDTGYGWNYSEEET